MFFFIFMSAAMLSQSRVIVAAGERESSLPHSRGQRLLRWQVLPRKMLRPTRYSQLLWAPVRPQQEGLGCTGRVAEQSNAFSECCMEIEHSEKAGRNTPAFIWKALYVSAPVVCLL
jgi:hypothetical protein